MLTDSRLSFDDADLSADIPAARDFKARTRRILVILHQERSNPGRIGRLLQEQGYRLDIRRPACGDALPRSMDGHDGAIIFGGPMSANDEHDYVRQEIEWIGVPLAAGKPFLGVCLGAQMLTRHLGHRVAPHPDGKVEIGYYPIRATAQGQAAWPLFPSKVYQWHREGFDLPAGATLLAEGDDFEAQAFVYGRNAYGLQFHPEVTYSMMCRWTTLAAEKMTAPNACPRDRHFQDWYAHDGNVARWLSAFLRQWVAGGHLMPAMGMPAMRVRAPEPQHA